MADDFEKLLKTDNNAPVETKNDGIASNIVSDAKAKIKSICKYLYSDSDIYNPSKSIDDINNYIDSQLKIERVLYSEISSYIFGLSEGERGTFATNVDKLLLFSLNDDNKVNSDCKKIVIKIYDHFHLALHQIENAHNILAESVESAKEDVRKDAKSMQKEYITILGIFAAIVLAFVGGITFSSSVLNNINAVSIYRLLIIVDVLAIVLSNAIYILIKFIMNINDKEKTIPGIKTWNIIWIIIAFLIVAAWIFDMHSISNFIQSFLPWIK